MPCCGPKSAVRLIGGCGEKRSAACSKRELIEAGLTITPTLAPSSFSSCDSMRTSSPSFILVCAGRRARPPLPMTAPALLRPHGAAPAPPPPAPPRHDTRGRRVGGGGRGGGARPYTSAKNSRAAVNIEHFAVDVT